MELLMDGRNGPALLDRKRMPRSQESRAPRRCRSCGLPLQGGVAHASDASCVDALRVEIRRLKERLVSGPPRTVARES